MIVSFLSSFLAAVKQPFAREYIMTLRYAFIGLSGSFLQEQGPEFMSIEVRTFGRRGERFGKSSAILKCVAEPVMSAMMRNNL
jgi:hypothetical protein